MTTAKFLHKGGKLVGFSVQGHTGLACSGEDVACASVSSAVQMAANTLTETLGLNAEIRTREALVYLRLSDAADEAGMQRAFAADAVLKGMRAHFKLLSEEFPGYIRTEDSEV